MLQDGRVVLSLVFLGIMLIVIILGIKAERDNKKEILKKIKANYGKKRGGKLYKVSLLKHHKEALDAGFHIDEITSNDMELDRVFASVNHTSSIIGQEYLYYQILRGRLSEEELKAFEEMVSFFSENEEERNKFSYNFEQLGKKDKVDIDKFLESNTQGQGSILRHLLCYLLLLAGCCLLVSGQAVPGFCVVGLFVIVTISMYFQEKGELSIFLDAAFYVVKLIEIGQSVSLLGKNSSCKSLDNIAGELETKVGGLKKAMLGSRYVFLSAPSNTSFLSSIILYVNLFFHFDIILFYGLAKRLSGKSEDIRAIYDYIGRIEAALAIDSYRASLQHWCKPEISSDNKITELYHPLIDEAVKNEADISRSMLITGANASGKSTYLRSMGLAIIMAQTINTVCADSYKAPFMRIYSSMSLKDNLKEGDSFFMTEIKALKRIIDASNDDGDRVICFVDEVLKGTNTIERIAAASQVIKYLIDHKVLCVFATHDMELSQLLDDYLNNYHFEEAKKQGTEDILFTYKLMNGPTNSKNAIRLLASLGIEGTLVDEAMRMSTHFEKTGQWVL